MNKYFPGYTEFTNKIKMQDIVVYLKSIEYDYKDNKKNIENIEEFTNRLKEYFNNMDISAALKKNEDEFKPLHSYIDDFEASKTIDRATLQTFYIPNRAQTQLNKDLLLLIKAIGGLSEPLKTRIKQMLNYHSGYNFLHKILCYKVSGKYLDKKYLNNEIYDFLLELMVETSVTKIARDKYICASLCCYNTGIPILYRKEFIKKDIELFKNFLQLSAQFPTWSGTDLNADMEDDKAIQEKRWNYIYYNIFQTFKSQRNPYLQYTDKVDIPFFKKGYLDQIFKDEIEKGKQNKDDFKKQIKDEFKTDWFEMKEGKYTDESTEKVKQFVFSIRGYMLSFAIMKKNTSWNVGMDEILKTLSIITSKENNEDDNNDSSDENNNLEKKYSSDDSSEEENISEKPYQNDKIESEYSSNAVKPKTKQPEEIDIVEANARRNENKELDDDSSEEENISEKPYDGGKSAKKNINNTSSDVNNEGSLDQLNEEKTTSNQTSVPSIPLIAEREEENKEYKLKLIEMVKKVKNYLENNTNTNPFENVNIQIKDVYVELKKTKKPNSTKKIGDFLEFTYNKEKVKVKIKSIETNKFVVFVHDKSKLQYDISFNRKGNYFECIVHVSRDMESRVQIVLKDGKEIFKEDEKNNVNVVSNIYKSNGNNFADIGLAKYTNPSYITKSHELNDLKDKWCLYLNLVYPNQKGICVPVVFASLLANMKHFELTHPTDILEKGSVWLGSTNATGGYNCYKNAFNELGFLFKGNHQSSHYHGFNFNLAYIPDEGDDVYFKVPGKKMQFVDLDTAIEIHNSENMELIKRIRKNEINAWWATMTPSRWENKLNARKDLKYTIKYMQTFLKLMGKDCDNFNKYLKNKTNLLIKNNALKKEGKISQKDVQEVMDTMDNYVEDLKNIDIEVTYKDLPDGKWVILDPKPDPGFIRVPTKKYEEKIDKLQEIIDQINPTERQKESNQKFRDLWNVPENKNITEYANEYKTYIETLSEKNNKFYKIKADPMIIDKFESKFIQYCRSFPGHYSMHLGFDKEEDKFPLVYSNGSESYESPESPEMYLDYSDNEY